MRLCHNLAIILCYAISYGGLKNEKTKTTKQFKNYKMTNEVTKDRKKVINVLYELKNMGYNLPIINDVRIGQSKHYNTISPCKIE